MNQAEFFTKYNKKFLDYDNAFGAQCVDVIKAFFSEVLNVPIHRGNARDYWFSPPMGFEKIKNGMFRYPQPGDIIIWDKTPTNPYGHIGICAWSRAFDFSCFEQNNPLGSPCVFKEHNYVGVLGWLRYVQKVQTASWNVPITIIGANIPGLVEQVQKWSKGTINLSINFIPMSLPYDPQKEYNVLVRDRFCIISCNPPPEIYKTTMTDDRQTVYAIAGPDALTASYEVSHMLHKYYLAHRGTNPYFDIMDTVGNVTDQERYQKYSVLKPYMDSVILKP